MCIFPGSNDTHASHGTICTITINISHRFHDLYRDLWLPLYNLKECFREKRHLKFLQYLHLFIAYFIRKRYIYLYNFSQSFFIVLIFFKEITYFLTMEWTNESFWLLARIKYVGLSKCGRDNFFYHLCFFTNT